MQAGALQSFLYRPHNVNTRCRPDTVNQHSRVSIDFRAHTFLLGCGAAHFSWVAVLLISHGLHCCDCLWILRIFSDVAFRWGSVGVGSTFVVGVARDVQVHAARCSHFPGCRTHCSSLHALRHCFTAPAPDHCPIVSPLQPSFARHSHVRRTIHTLHANYTHYTD